MALPTINGVVRAACQGSSSSGQQWVNVIHFRYAAGASTPGTTEMDLLAAELSKFYKGPNYTSGGGWVSQSCTSTTTLSTITMTPLDGSALAYQKTYSGGGGAVGNALPGECAPVLTIRTLVRGRRARGRIYLPAPAASNIDSAGRLSSTCATLTTNQWIGMAAALVPSQWVPGVASYGHGTSHGVPTSWAPFFTPWATVTMDLNIDVQRRRKM